jgi:hypothetical protein
MGVVLRFLQLVTRGAPRPAAALRPAGPQAVPLDEVPLDPADFPPLLPEEVAKLEVYCLANCATSMRYVTSGPDGPVPWIESYGNEFDIVARLGVLAPNPKRWNVEIDGPRYERVGAWGHLLNEHYLAPIERAQKKGRKRGPRTETADPFVLVNSDVFPAARVPRIYRYLNGGP